MASPLASEHYSDITSQIDAVLRQNQRAIVSIFADSTGTVVALDSNGHAIENKQVASISYTSSYTDVNTNIFHNGFLTITFTDGDTFKTIDNVDSFWYTIVGTPNVLRSLV